MAAATIASSRIADFGDRRASYALLTAPADGSTWDCGLSVVDVAFVNQIGDVAPGTAYATIASVVGSVLTFSVDSTAVDLYVLAIGQ